MLEDIIPKMPTKYGRYIEPFFRWRGCFFALNPENAIIIVTLIINLYTEVYTYIYKKVSLMSLLEDIKNPNICDEEALYAASNMLRRATIICGDYLDILNEQAQKR